MEVFGYLSPATAAFIFAMEFSNRFFFDSGESEFYDFFYPVSSQNNWDSYGAV